MTYAIKCEFATTGWNVLMRRFNWNTTPLAIAILVLFIFVLNPELRALLLVIDYLGVDLALLLLGGYIGRYWSVFLYSLGETLAFIATRATRILKMLRWIGYGFHPREGQWAHVDHLSLVSGVISQMALERLRR